MSNVGMTFLAALRSVGTAITMASAGVYMHRKNFVTPEGKRMFALLSQQVTIPALLFSKIVYCNQDWSSKPCPNVTESLRDVWILFFWPAYVVCCGLIVGHIAAILSGTPPGEQRRSVLAACAFANSTGLPITLLTVVHSNFPSTTELGRVDPTLYLSVYLLMYPVLQWGLGGWLTAPSNEEIADQEDDADTRTTRSSVHESVRHILNMEVVRRKSSNIGGGSPAKHILDLEGNLQHVDSNVSDFSEVPTSFIGPALTGRIVRTAPQQQHSSIRQSGYSAITSSKNQGNDYGHHAFLEEEDDEHSTKVQKEEDIPQPSTENSSYTSAPAREETALLKPDAAVEEDEEGVIEEIYVTWLETVTNVLSKCLQPPVIGALLGLTVTAITPLRGILVDLVNRDDSAPLEWMFDGLYEIGQAAVPINMIILGINLSSSLSKKSNTSTTAESGKHLSTHSLTAIVIAKMIVMPLVGVISTAVFATYVWDIPDDIDAAVYLVTMIVFITPTANNVMIMVELGGGLAMKESIARAIGWQYACAPFLLSITVAVVVGVASSL